ncbi:MAG: carbohydrate kinase [Ruminococcus sp.]|uniref:carbohydrate kinase family protein n=1 Tax=Ruminococcus sp. TaxID=41978 RepID=UPI0025F11D80|nr:carbohydrate kinase [Ruminococcus sp.]MCR5601173.1 carbohydrate kinase [Ruminococcus sp.]
MNNDMLIAIGEALIDFIPDKSGCQFGEVTAFSPKLGGAPANVCGAYTRLGGRSRLLTQLGDDPFGHRILNELNGCGVDTSCIKLTDKAKTALAFVSIGADGNRTFSFYRDPSADMLYAPENITESLFEDAYALHFCSVSLGDFPMKEAHRAAISEMRRHGGIISFDPNLRFPLWKSKEALRETVLEFLPLADIIKISDEELEFITGENNIEKALPVLLKGSTKLVIYTCGRDGAHAYTMNASAKSPVRQVKAIDTTGAGDGFIGSFLWKLHSLAVTADTISTLSGEVLKECLDLSNEFCAYSVQKNGAIASYPTIAELFKK